MVKKIGVLRGREDNFPNALFEIVARKTKGQIIAEPMQVGAESLRKKWDYDVILDRISHDFPFYRYVLKSAAAEGSYVIPNPFQWTADDKLLGTVASGAATLAGHAAYAAASGIDLVIPNVSVRNLKPPAVLQITGMPWSL